MRLTFELPEGACDIEYGDKRCPFAQAYGYCGEMEGDLCVLAAGADYQRALHAAGAELKDSYLSRHPTCPFRGVVRVTMEDENESPCGV